ncbi:hypothetical protein BUALT_Bualt05G0098600 [Buddleja alternifolia]|uniref:Protein XRI1 n=1 Tax=Buddleja alternifolia TaxID=168488 RepID=A0AAV6XR60_9LAMI|nr:hypothetical protein BUALT_Bualt05G0098600 [Buddleja alternifolia]
MGELLQSIAFRSKSSLHKSSIDHMDMSSSPPSVHIDDHLFLHEAADHHFSTTGYLEDVLFEFTSKRRRLLLFSPDEQAKDLDNSMENCWTSNLFQNYCGNFDSLSQITKCDRICDMERGEEAGSETYDTSSSTSISPQKELSRDNQWISPDKENLYCVDHPPIFAPGANERRTKRALAKVVYPFALVKPGGFEGDVTLNDINERILMPPTRPVRHPVGDFACRPLVSPEGPGLSGKAVVAFTRIHTQGRGTITIIRTRG